MKNRRSAYFPAMKFYYLPLILLCALSLVTGCRKSKDDNHCDDILSERPPTMAALIIVDRQTGDTILLSKDIEASSITITQEGTDLPSQQGIIGKQRGAPTYGAFVFHITDVKKGTFKYTIDIPGVGIIALSYINKEIKTDNECNPYYIDVTDPVIEGHEFTAKEVGSGVLINLTL
ncbi:hypothetical protein [Chitinophaga sp. S165]|uniref:hypothetical protein n=1 Tax=Chitinophaga sp. S165 TaxID=2135462 RepID=UPI000D716A22|nr:hypothetical protein [Chitinophaga sp. S165]PWV55596.1 hypothetical protein C7475_101102 [Chitinophaga sp. S165]